MLFRVSRSHFHSTIRVVLAFSLCALLALVLLAGALAENRRDQPVGQEPSTRRSFVSFISSPLEFFTPFVQDKRSNDDIWQVTEEPSLASRTEREITPQAYLTLRLNKDALQHVLRQAPMEFTDAARYTKVVMTLPLPDGTTATFRIEESPIMAPELAVKFPEIKTYRGQGIDDPTATLRFDVTPMGFHAQVLSAQETVYVDPYAKGDTENYISYFKRNFRKDSSYECLVGATEKVAGVSIAEAQLAGSLTVPPNGTTLRTYRLALGATGEYTIAAGGTVPLAMARMTTSMNRVNGIFERELAVRMTLVANNDVLIYTDPSTDGYTNSDGFLMLGQHQIKADTLIGTANYDMGHVFSTGGGGTARIRSTCNVTFKGQGVTGLASPVGDPFDVDFVVHEMGHQHGGLHTFNTTSGICSGFARTTISAFEPGSGSTPMSYVGTCAPNNLQRNANDYFHVRSLEEIVAYMTGAGNCAAQSATGNTPPTVNAGANFTIPRNTPFALTASASDVNGDAITYAWEEYDLGPLAPPEGDADGMARPIFRTYLPTVNPTRTFPSLQYILNNANVPPATYDCGQPALCITGESLPNITRTMNFQVTARDNRAGGGGIVSATMLVSVNAGAGPFVVTQPNTAVSWTGFTQQIVLWDVAGTTAAPVSAATVNILLSTDGGNTFPTVLAAGTANDGTEAITVPNLPTTTARIKVEAVGNIFFDISGANFSIAAGVTPDVSIAVSPLSAAEDGATNLVYAFSRTGSTTAPLTVNFSVGGTATLNTDYSQSGAATFTSSSGTAAFGAGSSTTTVTIDPTADVTVESNETVILTVTSGTGYNVGSPSAATGTITNDDATPGLSINDVSVAEGNSGTANAVFTVTLSAPSSLIVTVNFATADGTATQPGDYQSTAGTLTFNPGDLSKTINVPVNGDITNETNETFLVNLSAAVNANISDSQGLGTILNDDTPTLNYSLPNYSVSESGGSAQITVTRTGDPLPAVTVDYMSTDNSNPADFILCSSSPAGTASSRCDFNTALGTLRFAANEIATTFDVLITQDSYVEGNENLQLFLNNPTGGAVLGAQNNSTLQIQDDVPETSTNPILDTRNFVRQQYHDFLNREPDQPGWDFWTDNITQCNDPARRPAGQTLQQCLERQRETTSGAFFLSPEFRYTGFYVYCVYKGSLGRMPTFLEFMRDVQQVSRGIIIANAVSGATIEQNRAQYEIEFIQRPEFLGIYGALDNQAYVNRLFLTTGISVTDAEKQALVDGLNAPTETRASVLHKVVNGTRVISEGQADIIAAYGKAFTDSQLNPAFVQMEYFGYLRRNEDAAGFNFWLDKMNTFGDFLKAEMVRSFLLSPEYRQRFGPP